MLHTEHLYGFSPVWTLMWIFKLSLWINASPQTWHLCGFSSPWILLWHTRLDECVNRLPQTVHSNGFSPEWFRLCTARRLLLWQHLPHSVHLYLLLWIQICWYSPILWGWGHSPPRSRFFLFILSITERRGSAQPAISQQLHSLLMPLVAWAAVRPSLLTVLVVQAFSE